MKSSIKRFAQAPFDGAAELTTFDKVDNLTEETDAGFGEVLAMALLATDDAGGDGDAGEADEEAGEPAQANCTELNCHPGLLTEKPDQTSPVMAFAFKLGHALQGIVMI